jgi:hypothetical protein
VLTLPWDPPAPLPCVDRPFAALMRPNSPPLRLLLLLSLWGLPLRRAEVRTKETQQAVHSLEGGLGTVSSLPPP